MNRPNRFASTVIERHWVLVVLLVWAVTCGLLLLSYWPDILLFNLRDTDDNLRLMQVRDLLHGQGWYDLRQYRINPPVGANIHWSRVVDLPIAGMIMVFGLVFDGSQAERLAVALAPLVPLLLLLYALALTARRLIDPKAYPLVFVCLIFCNVTNELFVPERIDHHGWQLALLALAIAAYVDPHRRRGGILLGICTALSLAIGLEMIVELAIAAAATVLLWVADGRQRPRLQSYAVSVALTVAVGYLLFASYDNRGAVCDALSPVWVSDAVLGSSLLFVMAWHQPASSKHRLLVASGAAVALASFHAIAWPQCLTGLQPVSPEAQRLWLDTIREARPVTSLDWHIVVLVMAGPLAGASGWLLLAWTRREDAEQWRRTLGAAAIAFAALGMTLWAIRTIPAAQMLATIGSAAFIWLLVPRLWRARSSLFAFVGVAVAGCAATGAAAPFALSLSPPPPPTSADIETATADYMCSSRWALQVVDLQPSGLVMTFVQLGPRLITITQDDAIAGPYHRNSEQIVDVMRFWRGSEQQAHAIVNKYHARYVLSCPKASITAYFDRQAPGGFYEQLNAGNVPHWLQPIPLPEQTHLKMWAVTPYAG